MSAGRLSRQARRARWRLAGAALALVLLAGLAQSTVPANISAGVAAGVARAGRAAVDALTSQAPAAGSGADGRTIGASAAALSDIPSQYLAHYVTAAGTCKHLSWQLLAAIGKIESDHGRSSAPGVRSGVNRFGCCAGPMQFNLTNGPPSTWDGYKRPGDSVYDPADAIPAAARKLCNDGMARPPDSGRDPCPHVAGPAATHRALKRYNNACWYVHHVIETATRYTAAAPVQRRVTDPFLASLARDKNLTLTDRRGCTPSEDLTSGKLDLRVTSLLAAMSDRWHVRVSCLRTGHSRYVAGTRSVSNHTLWRALDIDQVNHRPVNASNKDARAAALWLSKLTGPLRPTEIGTPWQLPGPGYFTDHSHQGHLHIGYDLRLGEL